MSEIVSACFIQNAFAVEKLNFLQVYISVRVENKQEKEKMLVTTICSFSSTVLT